MFTHDMAESKQKEITIRGIDPPTMEALINFAYSGKINITVHNVQSLMMGASFLQLSRVRDACAEFLTNRLAPCNVIGMKSFADSLSCAPLLAACDRFAHKFFTAVVETSEEFLGLSFEDVQGFVSHDELHIESEEVVFRAVLRWVKHDQFKRAEMLPDLLACVRLPLLRPHFLTDEVASEELVRSSHKCRFVEQCILIDVII